jgi:bifunctional diaminopimelate decarboxylase / aspartate kinase
MNMLVHAAVDPEQAVETPYPSSPWVVMKFGGRSVSTAHNWGVIADLLEARIAEGVTPVVVHSALVGISNALIRLLESAVAGEATDAMLEEIRKRHVDLAAELEVDAAILDEQFEALAQRIAGVKLIGEVSPRVHARVLATGELAATLLGSTYLKRRGFAVQWRDVRTLLESAVHRNETERARYLSATCDYSPDLTLQQDFAKVEGFVLTQGFIARNPQGETVLLGRGGSDTTGAYLAGKLQARRLEIWTDVPGFFSADPQKVPSARLIRSLHYREAQEIASAGGGILHPRSISPVRRAGIPLYLKCTTHPDWEGTVVSNASGDDIPQLKAISHRSNITLISMESMEMWHEVGFLAEAFNCFREHGLSVDLISTSESNVTVSIDVGANVADQAAIDALAQDLARLCRVTIIQDCAAVTLVGRRIRTILHELSPALEVFQEQKVHLLTQAANDLNITFVVDTEHAHRLVQNLHALLVNKFQGGRVFGPTWEQLNQPAPASPTLPRPWWMSRRDELIAIAKERTAAYVYDGQTVKTAISALHGLKSVDRVLYAMKANSNRELLRIVHEQGACFECVSPGEIRRVREVVPDMDPARILFTPNFAPRAEYEWALEQGVLVTLDNLYTLKHWPELFKGKDVFVRIDTGQGRGHHEHVKTAGAHSKFGVPLFEVEELRDLAIKSNARVIGLHAHTGSGVLDVASWHQTGEQLLELERHFPELRYFDLGGGLGVPERPGQKPLDVAALDRVLQEVKTACGDREIWLEPGRFVVAPAGVLVALVTQTKGKGDVQYLGISTGMNSLIRPALYGAYHEIVNLSRLSETASEIVTVVGPNCETGDRLGSDRLLPPAREGDVMLIANVGAYGFVMSSHYNLRDPAVEVLI